MTPVPGTRTCSQAPGPARCPTDPPAHPARPAGSARLSSGRFYLAPPAGSGTPKGSLAVAAAAGADSRVRAPADVWSPPCPLLHPSSSLIQFWKCQNCHCLLQAGPYWYPPTQTRSQTRPHCRRAHDPERRVWIQIPSPSTANHPEKRVCWVLSSS